MERRSLNDDSGVNVTLEFILNFGVVLVLFTVLVVTYQSIMTQSQNIVTNEELKVVSNDIANRIVMFDRVLDSTKSSGGAIDELNMTFEIPDQIAGRGYSVYITGTSVDCVPFNDATINVRANFTIYHSIDPTVISSASGNHMIRYDRVNDKIVVT